MDMVQLDECTALVQLPGVQELSRRHQHRVLPLGSAIRALLDQAVADVQALAQTGRDPMLQRIAIFLQIWYGEHGTVAQVAEALQLSPSRVWHAVKPRAIELVTRRFLNLASGPLEVGGIPNSGVVLSRDFGPTSVGFMSELGGN
jgi:hypothetical protein